MPRIIKRLTVFERYQDNFFSMMSHVPALMGPCYTRKQWIQLIGKQNIRKFQKLVHRSGGNFKVDESPLKVEKEDAEIEELNGETSECVRPLEDEEDAAMEPSIAEQVKLWRRYASINQIANALRGEGSS